MLTLRPYQTEGIKFLTDKKRALLMDAPGLGKTVQATRAAVAPTLVVAPTYLTAQWQEFLERECPDSTLAYLAGGARATRLARLAQDARSDWTIINTEMLRTYKFPAYRTVIFDESHHLRGRNSQQAAGALTVARAAERVYLLSATPIVKTPDDLFMQLRLLDPNTFTSYYAFLDKYCTVVQTPWAYRVLGLKRKSELQHTLTKYAMGRSYKQVEMQLPRLIENIIPVHPSRDWRKKYDEVRRSFTYQDNIVTLSGMAHTLRRMALQPKLEPLLMTLRDNPPPSNGEPGGTVIFCWYKETAEWLATSFKCALITGDVSPAKRAARAQADTLVVATIPSLSEGVDLAHLNQVVFFEHDYVPGRLTQALARVRRFSPHGYHKQVTVIHIVLQNTIDAIVYRTATGRGGTIQTIMKEALR